MAEQVDPGQRLEFLKTEHAAVIDRVRHASSDLYRTETVVPLAIAVMYAWLYGGEDGRRDVPLLLWWIPVVAVLFGAARQWIRYRSLWGSHRYLRRIEQELYGEASKADIRDEDGRVFGWERYWNEVVQPPRRYWKWRVSDHGLMRVVFWLFLVAAAFALASYPSLTAQGSPSTMNRPAVVEAAPGQRLGPVAPPAAPTTASNDLLELLGAVWIPLLIVAGSFLVRAISSLYTARMNHRSKMVELAIDTANREFSTHATGEGVARAGSLPMSAYVIFHVVLFDHLERRGSHYPAEEALEDTLKEVEKIFKVYARSKIPEYRLLWDFHSSAPRSDG